MSGPAVVQGWVVTTMCLIEIQMTIDSPPPPPDNSAILPNLGSLCEQRFKIEISITIVCRYVLIYRASPLEKMPIKWNITTMCPSCYRICCASNWENKDCTA